MLLVHEHAILILPLCYFIGILRILRFHSRIYIILSIRYQKWLKCVFNVHYAVHSFGYVVAFQKKYPRKLVQCIAKCFPTWAKIFMNTQHCIDLFISKKIFIRMLNFCLEFPRYNLKSLCIPQTESLLTAVYRPFLRMLNKFNGFRFHRNFSKWASTKGNPIAIRDLMDKIVQSDWRLTFIEALSSKWSGRST